MSGVNVEKIDFKAALKQKAQIVNEVISGLIENQSDTPEALEAAIRYTLTSPGKRIRAALVMWCCELVSGRINDDAKTAAAVIEMVHTYSLIHDDLPAMDDDDMRRGMPTCHKQFNEAIAILAGDALLTLAFELLSTNISNTDAALALIQCLSKAAGPSGMVGGQVADLEAEQADLGLEMLEYIHLNKTAKMFSAAAQMGAIAGNANSQQVDLLGEFGLNLGLAFQIADDVLDISSTSEQLGKTAGKDLTSGKLTYPSLMGIEESKKVAQSISDNALHAISTFGPEADLLRTLSFALLERTK